METQSKFTPEEIKSFEDTNNISVYSRDAFVELFMKQDRINKQLEERLMEVAKNTIDYKEKRWDYPIESLADKWK